MSTTSHNAAVKNPANDGRWIATVVAAALGMLAIGFSLGSGGSMPQDDGRVIPVTRSSSATSGAAPVHLEASSASPPQPAADVSALAAIPATDEASSTTQEIERPALARLIKINAATAAELELLPGIGPAMAARIIRHRAENGPFRGRSDLDRVRGVGEKTLERLLPLVSFELPGAAPTAPIGR